SLLDLNITWTNTASPAPDVTIISPLSGTFADVTPMLNFSVTGGTAANVWYTINGGEEQEVCSSCSGNFDEVLYLKEGSYSIVVYTDNFFGAQKSDSVSFTIDMNGNYFDTYLDDSQGWSLSGPWWEYGNISYSDPTGGIVLNETFENSSVLNDWTMNNGDWEITGGEMQETSNADGSIVTYDNLNLQAGENYNITLVYYDRDDDESGIIFRYIDNDNFYKCSFYNAYGTNTPSENYYGLTKWEDGSPTVFDDGVYDVEDQEHIITVTIVEDNITCYLDGQVAYNVFDNSWDGGKVGIYNYYDQNTGYDDFIITTWEDELPSFISYPITTLQNIVEVTDVSWNNYSDNSGDEMSVEISTDGGANWHSAINGNGLGTLELDNDLVYRVNFNTLGESLLSLLDLNISWTHTASPPPSISVEPFASVIADTTPVFNVSIDGFAKTFWYTINDGEENIICEDCGPGQFEVSLLLEEEEYDVDFYANNSVGTESVEEVLFEVNMNKNYFDSFLDSSQIADLDGSVWMEGNITFEVERVGVYDDFDDGALDENWTTYSSNSYSDIGVRDELSYSGSYSVVADSANNGNYELSELITNYDFSGASDISLSFWYYDSGDEDDSGSDHSNHQNADAVYFTCDGNYWYHLVNLFGTSSWQQVDVDVSSDADFCETVDSNFAIKFTQYDNYGLNSDGIAWDNINISAFAGESSVVSYAINVSQSIRKISDIRWNTVGEDALNTIEIELSVDGGYNWFSVANGGFATGFDADNSLVYRASFSVADSRSMSLLDLNITWEEPPSIEIQYPENNYVYNFPITKMNYSISVSGSETLDSCWWTNDSGVTNYSVTCGNDIITSSVDGVNYWDVYANDSAGSVGGDSVQFIIDTAAPEIIFMNQTTSPVDEGSNFSVGVNVTDSNTESVWIVIWESVVGGTEKFSGFLSNLFGDIFGIDIPIDSGYDLIHNYTIYANDSTGLISNYSGDFSVLKMFFTLDNNPFYSDGISEVFVSGYLGLTDGADVINHPFNIWYEGGLIPFENLTAYGTYSSELNFTGQNDLFDGSLLVNVSDAGGYLTLDGANTSGSIKGIIDAGALVDWGAAEWSLLSDSCSDTINYYDGVSWGYSGTHDTYIDEDNPTTNYGSSNDLRLDTSPVYRTLLKFEDIFGYGLNKIPYDSSISNADLNVYVYDGGNPFAVYQILEDWEESSATYNGRLPGQTWESIGCAGLPSRDTTLLGMIDTSSTGSKSLEITNLVSSWSNGSGENYGVVFNPGSSNEVVLRSSEYVTVSNRPSLDVTFSSTSCAGIEVYVRTSQDGNSWSEWSELKEGDEIIDSYGVSRYLEYDIVMGSFSSTIKPLFYDIEFNYSAIVTDANGLFNYSFIATDVFGTYDLNFTSGFRTIFAYEDAELKVQSGIDPIVELVNPVDGSWFDDGFVSLIYNATDLNDNLEASSLVVDDVWVMNNQSQMNNGLNYFNYTFSEGCHVWHVNVS
ncbi:MAG: DNRLRE domain-containing protein, partial [Candidatus Pacearchaeota archaeon]|nr:DNRLRE domain-containing protein [Candidatus Pacearchaeota archaeon]